MLKPASAGTGVIAGGSVRSVVEAAGIRDLLSKSMGSNNPVNVVRATIEALGSLRSADAIAANRGKTAEQLLGKRGAEEARRPHEYRGAPRSGVPVGRSAWPLAASGQPGKLRVTWVRSTIGHKAGARGTIRALGLHRLNQTVEIADTPVNRGMLRRVAFLLKVQEPARRRREGETK